MATPDIQNLFERFLRIYGGQGGSTEPTRSEPPYQSSQPAYSAPADAFGSNDGYAPTGGVLGGLNSSLAAGPWWARALAGPGGLPTGLRGPQLGGRIGGLPFFPTPGRNDVVEIPDPHLERSVPQWMRNYATAHALMTRMLVDNLDRRTQEPDVTAPFPKPEDRSGGLGWYVGAPQLEEELKRSTRPSNVRILQTVSNDDAAGKDVASPPLAPENPADTEGCEEEIAQVRRDCEKGMSGPPGQGPYSRPLGRRGRDYTIDDCVSDIVSWRCGGNPLRHGLSGAEAAKRNNDAIQKKRGR